MTWPRLSGLWRFRRVGTLRATCLTLAVAADACGGMSDGAQPADTSGTFDFAQRIGWIHGSCIAIKNAALASGTPVALVITGEPQQVRQARIAERTTSPEKCQALMPGRSAGNAKPGMFFYSLDAPAISATDMGIGIVKPPANPGVMNGRAQVDLDRDGIKEVFSSCATTEGIKFAVWAGKAYQGEPRWSGYYYLDYETKPSCP